MREQPVKDAPFTEKGFYGDYTGSEIATLAPHDTSFEAKGKAVQRIRLLLIDSDPDTAAVFRKYLQSHNDFDMLDEVTSSADAAQKISALGPDAIFVDVDMLNSSGLDAAALLRQEVKPVLVFLTSHRDDTLQAFELGAADFLLKPVQEDRFQDSLRRVREHVSRRETEAEREAVGGDPSARIAVTDRRGTYLINTREIDWIGAAGDYSELHVKGKTHLLRQSLSLLAQSLPNQRFCRIHRSSIVNLGMVTGYKVLRNQDLLVMLQDRTVLRSSRTFSPTLRRVLTEQCEVHG